jgi:hypothetical protein
MGIKSVMRKLVEGKWMIFQWYYENSHYDKVMKWYLCYLLIQTWEVPEVGSFAVGKTCLDGGAGRCLRPCLFNPCKLIDKFQNLLLYFYAKY